MLSAVTCRINWPIVESLTRNVNYATTTVSIQIRKLSARGWNIKNSINGLFKLGPGSSQQKVRSDSEPFIIKIRDCDGKALQWEQNSNASRSLRLQMTRIPSLVI